MPFLSFLHADFRAIFTCDDTIEMFADGNSLGKDNSCWRTATSLGVPGDTPVTSVKGSDMGGLFGILGSANNGPITNETWKCTSVLYPGWNSPDFDDTNWPFVRVIASHIDEPWGLINGIKNTTKWIWAADSDNTPVYCRLNLQRTRS